ncbi:MAG: glutamate synthase subunit beta [Gallionella sp.]|nr:glutamate synthase subunit beta [Gallionella sp.]
MGKPTGFMEFQRLSEDYLPVADRLKNYKEFVLHLTDAEAGQQAARCMDCGIPFCTSGCPINNIIPDWNDLVYRGNWKEALDVLHSTNNFPEFTGRICPAPCEAACTVNLNGDAVGIKSIEHAIIDKAWENGWVVPQPSAQKTGKKVAVVGSGPAGMAAAQQLARAGHDVTLFEKNDRVGGLLRYGIPDFKFEKSHIDRRVAQMEAEGVTVRTGVFIGQEHDAGVNNLSMTTISPAALSAEFDAVILSGGSEVPRDLTIPGRQYTGVYNAMAFLPQQNRVNAGDVLPEQIKATGKRVVVIGGGDTGSDCVGTSNRHGAISVMQLEVMPRPPEAEDKSLVWPNWPLKLRTSSSHDEGCERDWSVATKEFVGNAAGQVTALRCVRLDWSSGKPVEITGSEFELQADLVFLAMGFVHPGANMLAAFGVEKDGRGNVAANTENYRTSVDKVFAAGDMRRGQSLVVWAIREGRQCARAVDEFLMGSSVLPR